MKLQPIPRRSGLTAEEFREEYLKPCKPVVFTDLARDWPATEKWTFDWLKQNYGDLEVPLCGKDFHKAGKGYMNFTTHMPFAEYLDLIQTKPTELRMFLYNIFKEVPELREDFSMPNIMSGWHPAYSYLFFGGQGSTVNLHYDIDYGETFLTQFQTRKKVILFGPENSTYLYREPYTVYSLVDIQNPDYAKYPALEYAQGFETVIGHGETVYIPHHYWHFIEYVDGGFGMSVRAHHGVTNRLLGLRNIMRHFFVDKGMNYLMGDKWHNWKKQKAQHRAQNAMRRRVA